MTTADQQLTLEIAPHPALIELGREAMVEGEIKVKGALPVSADLNDGEKVTIQIANADGEIIAHGTAAIGIPTFKPIKTKAGTRIGTVRVHAAEIEAEL